MGRERPLVVGLALVMVLGFAVYFRLWAIDYSISSTETDILRQQFDLANKEAMDESAEWRSRYDEEVERANKCVNKLTEVKELLQKKVEYAASVTKKLGTLEKENTGLLKRVESLKRELKDAKLKCPLQ